MLNWNVLDEAAANAAKLALAEIDLFDVEGVSFRVLFTRDDLAYTNIELGHVDVL